MKIVQPENARYGITGGEKIISVALENQLKVAPLIGVCTTLGVAATLHISSIFSEGCSQEHHLDMFETVNKILKTPLEVNGGKAIIPTGSGLGIEIDEEFVRAHSSDLWSVRN